MNSSVIIIGAGVSGLSAARTLNESGVDVLLLDKGRGVGGRVATRWMGDRDHIQGRWDHGAQFATFRNPLLIEKLKSWNCWDLMQDWLPSHHEPDLPRKRPLIGMNSFAKALADGLHIERSCRVTHLQKVSGAWELNSAEGKNFRADTVISTMPIPQFLDLQRDSELSLTDQERTLLNSVRYERCLTLLAELDGPSGLDHNGYLRVKSGILDTLIDQHQKGISPAHCVVAHAQPGFSLEWYDRDRSTAASVMRAAMQEKVSSSIVNTQIHGWKFSKAAQRIPHPCLPLEIGCLLAGDGFTCDDLNPRIENAMLSGMAAASRIIENKG